MTHRGRKKKLKAKSARTVRECHMTIFMREWGCSTVFLLWSTFIHQISCCSFFKIGVNIERNMLKKYSLEKKWGKIMLWTFQIKPTQLLICTRITCSKSCLAPAPISESDIATFFGLRTTSNVKYTWGSQDKKTESTNRRPGIFLSTLKTFEIFSKAHRPSFNLSYCNIHHRRAITIFTS